ncbi:MAG: hypothetical protein O3B41_00300 [Bacteroidetes bacterium]|nr:hypothetical protein [Bacteroidota bacterium]
MIKLSGVNLIFLMMVFWTAACSPPPEEMSLVLDASDSLLVNVLIDLHEVDAGLFTSAKNNAVTTGQPLSLSFTDTSLRDSVLRSHDMSNDEFNELIEARLAAPERFLLVYNQVLDQSAANQ